MIGLMWMLRPLRVRIGLGISLGLTIVGLGSGVFAQSSPPVTTDADVTQDTLGNADSLGESPIVTPENFDFPDALSREEALAQWRYQRLSQADRLYQQGQLDAASALYRAVKQPEGQPLVIQRPQYPEPIVNPDELPPAGRVYWREYQAGLTQNLASRIQVPLVLLTQNYPQFIPGFIALADWLNQQNQPEAALEVLKDVGERYPQEPDLLRSRLAQYARVQQWIEAMVLARQFALFNPEHPQAAAFNALADDYLQAFQRDLRQRLTANAVANVFTGALSYALTGGILGPLSAVQTSAMLLQGESNLGGSVAEAIRSREDLVEDEIVLAYVREVGAKLVAVSGRSDFTYEFDVLMEPDLNAFALPGGKVFVNAGAIVKTNSEAELAGLLAHEISHAILSHGFKLMTEGNVLANLGQLLPYGGTAAQLISLNYSREMERQADALGTRILASAGYAADGVENLMKTLATENQEREANSAAWLSTHPQTQERIDNLTAQIQSQNLNIYQFEGVERHRSIQAIVRDLLAEDEDIQGLEN